jgi:membrane protein YfhO
MLGWPRSLGVGRPATPSLFGLADVRGVAALPVERYVRYLEAISPNAAWYVWQAPGDDVLRHPLLDLAGTRYLVRPRHGRGEPEPLLDGDAAVRLAYRDAHVAIYENDAALPRARIVHAAVAVRDPEEAFHRLVEAAAASAHAAAARLVDRIFIEPSADGDTPAETPAAAPSTEHVQMVPGNDPDQIELDVGLSVLGWVVLADTFYPGWTATIDGVATPIHPVDLLFRGVLVPPGTHRIMFRYQPPVFRLGLALAVVGLAVSGLLLVRGARAEPGQPLPWRPEHPDGCPQIGLPGALVGK